VYTTNVIVRPDVYERYRVAVRGEPFLWVGGKLAKDDGVVNVLAEEGIVGIAALAAVLLGALVIFFRISGAADARARAIGLGCGAGLVTVCLHSILDVTLFSELAFPFFALLGVGARLLALDDAADESVSA
jgi:hypothetical protein